MSNPSEEMRKAWAEYECQPERMVRIDFGPDTIRVAPPTADAWMALEHVLAAHRYDIRIEDTDSYNCRDMKSGQSKSLHAYGIALDINWKTNPYIDHAGQRKPRFSDNAEQGERAQDVRLGRADTDMTRDMVDAALAIKTVEGKQVFGWGGDWRSIKDAMHFQIEATPEDLGKGIDWSTVPRTELSSEPDDHAAASPGEQENASMELPKIFFDTVRTSLFGGTLSQSAVDNINTITGYWMEHYPGQPLNQLAYILATVKAEVGANMRPVREGFAKDDADARKKLAHRPYAKSDGPYGHAYYGRGYVQLTHLQNYTTQSAKLGVDLVKFPDKALETPIALQILAGGMLAGDFNGKGFGLGHYVNDTRQDFVGARRTVNIQDRAEEIAGYAELFLVALKLAKLDDIDTPTPPQPTTPAPHPGTVAQGWVGAEELAETNALLRRVLARLDAAASVSLPSGIGLPPAATPAQPGQAAAALLQQLGLGSVPPERLAALLAELEKTGIIVPGQHLTPVNRALGETVGKALNGKKTVIGIAGLLVSMFLPQLAPLTTFLTNVTPVDGGLVDPGTAKIAVQSIQEKLMPLSAIIAGWGGLGKIDKWMHKPAINTLAELLAAVRK